MMTPHPGRPDSCRLSRRRGTRFRTVATYSLLTATGSFIAGACTEPTCEESRTCAPDDPSPGDGDSSLGGGGTNGVDETGGMGGMGAAAPALECDPDQIACDGECVDPATDVDFCGARGNCTGSEAGEACAADLFCESGVCLAECEEGLVSCDGACINPLTDEAFCGAANLCVGRPDSGRVCEVGEECLGGSCRSWRGPRTHSTGNSGTAEQPSHEMGIDAEGNVFAGYAYGTNVFALEFDATIEAWSNSIPLESLAATAAFEAIAVASDGRADVVWMQELGAAPAEIISSSFDGAVWQLPLTQQSVSSPIVISDATAAADRSGRTHTLWIHSTAAGATVNSRLRDAGQSSWLTATPVRNVATASMSSLRVAAIESTGALAVWKQVLGSAQTIQASMKVASDSWTALPPVPLASADAVNVRGLAGSAKGDAVVAFSQGGITYSVRFREGEWEELGAFPSDGTVHGLQIVMDDSGATTATFKNDATTFFATRLEADGASWDEPVPLATSGFAGVEEDLAVDGFGNVTVVWLTLAGQVADVWASRFSPEAGSWSEPMLLEEDNVFTYHPRVVSNDAGQTMVVWWRDEGEGIIGFNRLW